MKKRSSDSDRTLFLMILSLIEKILEGANNYFVPPKSFKDISRFVLANMSNIRSGNKDDWKKTGIKIDASHSLDNITDWLAIVLATIFTINEFLNQIRSAEDLPAVNLAQRANRIRIESKEIWTNQDM